MDNKLSQLIENGATIVTPSERLSRHISYQFSQKKIKEKTSWITPDCLPWEVWCKVIFDKLLFSAKEPLTLLNDYQQQWLWEGIIKSSRYSVHLLRTDTTSKEVMRCYKLCKEWNIPIFPKDIDLSEDASAFKEWVYAYQKKKSENFWLDNACLPDYVSSHFKEINFHLEKITFYGFNQLTKQQSILRELLIDLDMYIDLPDGKDRHQSIAFSIQKDLDSEIHAAACWAKEKLKENGSATIGITFRNINKIRGKLEYGFSSVLTPEKWTKSDPISPKPYSISMGKSLSTYSLIHVAINLLSLGANKIPMSNLSNLLNSSFIRAEGGSILDAKLRSFGETKLSLERLRSMKNKECANFIKSLENFNMSFQSQAKKKMKLSMWITNFTEWLTIFGWPNKQLDSEEHQTLQKWNGVLSNLGSLSEFDESVDFKTAFSHLKKMLAETHFQPKALYETPIQILGMTGVTGAQFDFLWITNARDDNWLSSGAHYGFIPYTCQMSIPGKTPESRLQMAEKITDELVRSAKSSVFSYIKQEGDENRLRLSPLIKSKYELKEYNETPEDDYRKRMLDPEATEEIEDCNAPVIESGQKVSAGSSLLEDQSACPFRAFAKHRLNARVFEDPDDDLNDAGRGKLAHRAMEYLWRELETLDNLKSMPDEKLDDIVCSVISEAIENQKIRKPEIFKPWFINLEQRRLKGLLKEWLTIECNRSQFTVHEKEKEKIVIFGDIEFRLRIDRIDKLGEDRYLIIDYKTGAVTKNNWTKDRPKEPQLPLYAITSEYPLSGLAYACLKPSEFGFDGYVDTDEILPQEKKIKIFDIKELLNDWEKVLGNLADEFRKGCATVTPRKDACTYCHLGSLCRIKESEYEKSNG